MNLEKKLSEIKNVKICKLTSKTGVKLLKKSRVTGEPCPYKFVEKITTTNNFVVGADYEKLVHKAQKKSGVNPDFEKSTSWFTPISENGVIVVNPKNPENLYIKGFYNSGEPGFIKKILFKILQKELNIETYSTYFADGKELKGVELENAKKEYFPIKAQSKKQLSSGVNTDLIIEPRVYKISSILDLEFL